MRYLRDIQRFSRIETMLLAGSLCEFVPCAYCGLPSSDQEHVIPRGFIEKLEGLADLGQWRLFTVPACRECNSVSGKKVFTGFHEKRKYIRASLRRRYKSILEIPRWSEEDLSELSLELARYVRQGLRLKEITLRRLNYAG